MHVCAFVCECVAVCALRHMHINMCVEDSHFCGGQRIVSDVGSQEHVYLSFESGSLTYVDFVK